MTLSNPIPPSLWHDCDSLYIEHQSLCLQLQDDHQLNVNLLLLALWLDKHHYLLPKSQWHELHQATLTWEQALLLPYRQLRRRSKAILDTDEYQQMLKLELMLERKSQARIFKTLLSMPVQQQTKKSHNVGANLCQYLALFNLNCDNYPSLQSCVQ